MADAKKAAASEVQEAKKETKLLKKSDCTYTAFWCEENIYKLCETAGIEFDHSCNKLLHSLQVLPFCAHVLEW